MSAERKVSQNEIDALFASTLGGEAISNDEGGDSPPPAGSSSAGTETTGSGISNLNKILVPVLQEKLSAAARRGVSFNAPSFNSIGQAECLEEHKDTTYLKARVTFSGSLSGQIILLFTKREALTIADLVAGRFDGSEIPEEADDIHLDAFNDVLNEVKPSLADSFGGLIGGQVDVDFSRAEMGMLDGTADELPDPLVEIRYPVSVEDVVEGRVVAIVSDDFLSLLEGGSGTDEGDGSSDASSDASSDTSSDSSGDDLDLSGPFGDMLLGGGGDEEEPPSGGDAGEVDDDLQSLLQQFAESSGGEEAPQPAMPFGAPEAPAAGGFQQPVSVKPVEFSPLTPGPRTEVHGNIEVLLDIPLNLTVELGRTTKNIKEILELSTGAVVELQKLAGESVELLVNGKLIAKGEVVVIDENFGIRITSIISREERLQSLR